MQEQPKQFLTLKEAAAQYGFSPEYLRQLAVKNQLPGAFRIRGRWRVDPDLLRQAWIPQAPAHH